MADEMEEIEARLAAYVDGTLPTEQRAEIEAYLKANATHARLISELRSIRSAVVNLPKERAPAEVLDSLQAQLERQTLLGDTEETDTLKINRWPQLGAVAAVLLLAAGLGVLVYQVLPGQRQANSDLALLTSNASRPNDDAGGGVTLDDGTHADVPAAKPAAEADAGGRMRVTPPAMTLRDDSAKNEVKAESPSLTLSQPGVSAAPGAAAPDAVAAAELRALPAAPMTASTSPATVTLSDPLRVIIVRSDDPVLTQNLLMASLTQTGTAVEVLQWPTDVPLTTQPTTGPLGIREWVGRLQRGGELTAEEVAEPKRANPLVLRNVTGEQAYALLNQIALQRPEHQEAEWAHNLARRLAMQSSTKAPASAPDSLDADSPIGREVHGTSQPTTMVSEPKVRSITTGRTTITVVTDSLLSLDGTPVPSASYAQRSDLAIMIVSQQSLNRLGIWPAVTGSITIRPTISPATLPTTQTELP